MDYISKAKIILESLDDYMNINYNLEDYYLRGIIRGLQKIDKQEKEEGE